MEKVYQQHWIDLPKDVRNKLTEVFEIPNTGITEVRDQTVLSDGTTNTDLLAITAEKMAAYVGSSVSDTSYHRLWELTLAKVHSELNPPQMDISNTEIEKELPETKEETQNVNKETGSKKSTTKESK